MAGHKTRMSAGILAAAFIAAAALFVFSCRVIDSKGRTLSDDSTSQSRTAILKSFILPAHEVSGLCNFTDPATGNKKILAINDSNYQLLTIDLDEALRGQLTLKSMDLTSLMNSGRQPSALDKHSQWEAIQSDRQGRVYISDEERGNIHVIDLKKTERIATIKLNIPDQNPRFAELKTAWDSDAGSRVEGFILLDNGHILAAKEKNPPALIEFAPKDERPTGFSSPIPALSNFSSTLRIQPPWPGSTTSKSLSFEAIKFWLPSTEFPDNLDLSELAVTPSGDLAVLSDRLAELFYIGQSLGPSETKFKLVKRLPLPQQVEKPEGLAMISNIEILVASDLKTDTPNFFHLRLEEKLK